MKKLLVALAAVVALSAHADETLIVGVNGVQYVDLLGFVKPMLAADGVDLQIKPFADYIQPNVEVDNQNIDANFFQSQPNLEAFNKSNGTSLVGVAKVILEPLGAYSSKYKAFSELPEGAIVALPNDPPSEGRALLLLAKAGLITLQDPTNILATLKDVAENPHNLQFREMEGSTLPRVLTQVELALIKANDALSVQLDPTKDTLLIEGSDSPYVNILVARSDNRDSIAMQKLVVALHSPEMKQYILEKYQGALVPAF